MQYLKVAIDRVRRARCYLRGHPEPPAREVEGRPIGIVLEGAPRTPLVLRVAEDVRDAPRCSRRCPLALGGGFRFTVARLARVDGAVVDRGTRPGSRWCSQRRRPRPRRFRRRGQAAWRRGELPAGYFLHGAGSSRTSSGPPRGSRWWCRSRSGSCSCCCSRCSDRCARRCSC